MSSKRDLPWDHLATSDKAGKRIYLYPTAVRGRWAGLRSKLSVVLIALFLGLPWVQVNGHQALLLDISNRRFAIFGLTFWAHDAPLLFFVLGGAALSLAFVTAIWGRVWCGWACPQTVFVEQVFRRIERWIEGDSIAQKKLDASPMTLDKGVKKSVKWLMFTLLALILSHSFMAYFIGTHELELMMASSPAQNPSSFGVMAAIAALVLFDFGWFREQFCTIVCPYGRFQSVLMDSQSTVVAYDTGRTDCVNCYRCVQVCPTGVDIRRGVQLECIACTACIDACDDVMKRIKKPLGLIKYGNQAVAEGKIESWMPWYKRSRAWVYLTLLAGCFGGLTYSAQNRDPLELTLNRAVGGPYQEVPKNDGGYQIVNHFKVDLRNQTFDSQLITFSLDPALRAQGVNIVVSNHKTLLAPGELERADLFVEFQKSLLIVGKGVISIQILGQPHSISLSKEVHLVGPFH